ncbi:hypothetical protein T440DRAFT_432288 [Plenodomus tracheiphilus IPT5]|uniref:Rhodopsin domain-containing protein n=1 Tax=Plenodomus tracheiphilus IPT5 TaxID=1408161 RepID=A0A6A7ATH7_9PLEO|nr:hypothetical protein T440DRAFT_432288 [Plenodomus tracheiphilus IPT5]
MVATAAAAPATLKPRLHAEISQTVFLGVVWTFVALSLIFVIIRCAIKLKTFKRISSDDIIALFAWVLFLTNIILWTVMSPRLYDNYEMLQGKGPFDEAGVMRNLERYGEFIHCIAPFTIMFYTSLWSVKISLLLFFRKLGHQIRSHEIWWWCVLFVTVSTWAVCVGNIDYACSTRAWKWIMTYCPVQAKIDYQNSTFYANCALDIISDCLIVSIPVLILWNTRVPLRRKLVLVGIFSVTVIVMVVSVIRVRVVNSKTQNSEIAWLIFWSYIENGTAIMISCVASFRQLFVAQERAASASASKSSAGKSFFTIFTKSKDSRTGSYGSRDKSERSLDSERSAGKILPLNNIHVHSMVSVSSDNASGNHTAAQQGYSNAV